MESDPVTRSYKAIRIGSCRTWAEVREHTVGRERSVVRVAKAVVQRQVLEDLILILRKYIERLLVDSPAQNALRKAGRSDEAGKIVRHCLHIVRPHCRRYTKWLQQEGPPAIAALELADPVKLKLPRVLR